MLQKTLNDQIFQIGLTFIYEENSPEKMNKTLSV